MNRICLLLPLFCALTVPALAWPPIPAPFIPQGKCECRGDYKPGKGVFRISRMKIGKEWETRYYCNESGSGKSFAVDRQPYKVLVTTYRERYSDGTQRVWKCVHSGTETLLIPPSIVPAG